MWTVQHTYVCVCVCVSQDPPDWQEILAYFRGSELQNYFTRVLEDNLKVRVCLCVCVCVCVRVFVRLIAQCGGI